MTDQIVTEWMAEWKSISAGLSPEKNVDFANSILANDDLFQAITHVLEENDRFRTLYTDVISTLFMLYRSPDRQLRLFSAQFIPTLVYVYLHQIHAQKKCVALETLLRGIFEIESTLEDRAPSSIRIPNVNLPSVYHDPGGVSTSWLSDSDLDRLNLKTVKIVNRPTLILTDERIRAPQRLPLCTEIWWIFNHRLPDLPKHPVPLFLKMISKLVTQGFNITGPQRSQPPVRIVLSSKLLIEMVHTIYYSIYTGAPTLAEQVLEEALNRANYQLWADAMLVCNAVRSYLKSSELPIQVEVVNAFKKSIITNASFRTKKLPDDIPIVETETTHEEGGDGPSVVAKSKISKIPQHILAKIKRNSVVVITEEGDVETMATPSIADRKKSISIDATAV